MKTYKNTSFRPNLAIHCKTEREAMQLFTMLKADGYTWNGGDELTAEVRFSEYGKDTCYILEDEKKVMYTSLLVAKEAFDYGEIEDILDFYLIAEENYHKQRLVDANVLLSNPFLSGEGIDKENANEHFVFGLETAAEMIENTPTAFDLEGFLTDLKLEINRMIPENIHDDYTLGQSDTCINMLNILEELLYQYQKNENEEEIEK